MPRDARRSAGEESPSRRRIRPLAQLLLGSVLAIALGVSGAFAVYQISVQPGAAIVKGVFEQGQLVTPPSSFAAASRRVTQRRVSLAVTGAPRAYLDIYAPTVSSTSLRPIVLWIHGGGFISSSASTVADYCILLAHAGYTVASLDYSLAPQVRYPAPIRQGNAALAFLVANATSFGGDAHRIVVGGDSAGAQIAGQLAAVETDRALAADMGVAPAVTLGELRGAILFCGIYDLSTVGTSGFPALRTYLWAYTGQRDWERYPDLDQMSTTMHITSAYPPTFVSVGDADPFRAQGSELASALRRQGTEVSTLFWNGTGDHLDHEYQFDFRLPQATTAFHQTLSFLAAHTTGEP